MINKMEDNSIISNFANDEDFELMILNDLHQIIEMIADRYQEDRYPFVVEFKFCCQEILKMEEEQLNRMEISYNIGQEMEERIFGINEMTKRVNEFCDESYFITKLIKRKLILFLNIDPGMTNEILYEFSNWYVHTSDARGIANRYKLKYEKLTDIILCEEEFIQYLILKPKVYLDAESMKVYLSEYMDNEVEKFYNLPKNKKYKQKTLIDITPHQTLSIDTTSAHVEEGKEVEIIIKDEVNGTPCIEFDNLFGADIKRKNEVWQYMKLLRMIDSDGKYLLKFCLLIISTCK